MLSRRYVPRALQGEGRMACRMGRQASGWPMRDRYFSDKHDTSIRSQALALGVPTTHGRERLRRQQDVRWGAMQSPA